LRGAGKIRQRKKGIRSRTPPVQFSEGGGGGGGICETVKALTAMVMPSKTLPGSKGGSDFRKKNRFLLREREGIQEERGVWYLKWRFCLGADVSGRQREWDKSTFFENKDRYCRRVRSVGLSLLATTIKNHRKLPKLKQMGSSHSDNCQNLIREGRKCGAGLRWPSFTWSGNGVRGGSAKRKGGESGRRVYPGKAVCSSSDQRQKWGSDLSKSLNSLKRD